MKCCVIVDGCSTGKYLAPILNQKGYKCIHVQSHSTPYAIEHGGANPHDYIVSYIYDGNFEKLVHFLEEHGPSFIIPGSEPGVELAYDLAVRLNLFPNHPDSGHICRNKYLTHETLKKAGLPHIRQHLAKNIRSTLKWARDFNRWPIIIKPTDSGGGDGFFLCHDEEDLRHNFPLVLDSTNIFDKRNEEVLLQECLKGDEYVVNTVSADSSHYIESIMKHKKRKLREGHVIYDSTSLVRPINVPQLEKIKDYIFKVLDALGIRNGATHCELFITKDGPILVECNARLMGASLPTEIMASCLGISQVELLINSYIQRDEFLKKYAKKEIYSVKSGMIVFYFSSKKSGVINHVNFLDNIKNIPSTKLLRIDLKKGDSVRKTIDLPTCTGDVFLVNKNKIDLQSDYRKIKHFDQQGVFSVVSSRESEVHS